MDENRTNDFGGFDFYNKPEKKEEPVANEEATAVTEETANEEATAVTEEAANEEIMTATEEVAPTQEEEQPSAAEKTVWTAPTAAQIPTPSVQNMQQKVDAFYSCATPANNGCTYSYGRAQQPAAQPAAAQNVRQTPPVYSQGNSYTQPNTSSYRSEKTVYSDSAANRYTAPVHEAEPKKKPKKDKDKAQKSRMSVGQVILCMVLCLAVGSVSGFVSSKKAVSDTLEDFMETFTAATTTAAYNINIYEQQTESATQQQGSTEPASVPVANNTTASDVYKQNVNAVVNITAKGTKTVNYGFFFGSQQQQFTSSGSGFFLTEDGYILTNYHVVEDATTFIATDFNGKEYSARLVGYEESNDIAVLKVSGTFQAVKLGSSRTLEVGDTLLIIGNALGELQYTLTQGVVSYLERSITTDTGTVINMLQTDAAINSGNSGGPVFNAKGEVVGIASAKYASSTIEGLGFCIPIDDVKHMINDIINTGYVTGKPAVGLSLYTNTSRSNGLPYGCYVVAVESGSCSAAAGIKEGDVITAVNGKSVSDVDDFGAALNGKKAGEQITMTVYFAAQGTSSDVTVTLDEYIPSDPRTQYTNVYDY